MIMHWSEAQDTLQRLAAEPRFGLFSDFDGTLAPLAATAGQVQPSQRVLQLLSDLREQLPIVALISGRRVAALHAKVNLPGLVYVGNHGLETLEAGEVRANPAVQAYRPALQAALHALQALNGEGTHTEDKGLTLTVHYRQAADPQAFARQHEQSVRRIAAEQGLEFFTGKMVFELRPPLEIDKGVVLRELVQAHGIKAALFLGDDVTDISALRMAGQMRKAGECAAWGVAVQAPDAPEELEAAADWRASGVEDVEDLLAWLLAARKASST